MHLKVDIPAHFNRLNSSSQQGEFVLFLLSHQPRRQNVLLSDCVTTCDIDELPDKPKLMLSDSNPDSFPPPTPPMRRAVSDGAALAQDSQREPVMDVHFSEAAFIEGGGYLFRSRIPVDYFDGKYTLSGCVSLPESNERLQFEFELPRGSHECVTHIAYGSLSTPFASGKYVSMSRVLLSFLDHILSGPDMARLPLHEKAWLPHSLLKYLQHHPDCYGDNKREIGEAFLVEIASLVEGNKFRHHDIALVAIGQLRDLFSIVGPGTLSSGALVAEESKSSAAARILYSLPLSLLRDGYSDNMDDHKLLLSSAQIRGGSDRFATSLWIRRGLTLLLDLDIRSPIPSFRSCRGVIPLLRSLRSSTAMPALLYSSRADWGALGRLERVRSLLLGFRSECAPFLRSSLSMPLEDIRGILATGARGEESQVLAGMLASLCDIEAQHRTSIGDWSALSDSESVQIVRVKELLDNDCPAAYQHAVNAFDTWMGSLEGVMVTSSKYLGTLNRMNAENVAVNPSFRRLWGFKDFLLCKHLLRNRDTVSAECCDDEHKSGVSDPTPAVFVQVFAGIGTKGPCTPLLPQYAAAQGVTFNQPQALAVCQDGNGHPLYSTGLGGKGEVYVADTLNHAIRAVVKPNEAYTLAGNGVPGTWTGDSPKSQFQSPRGLCTAPISDSKGGGTILVVCDTINHCVKGMLLFRGGDSATQNGLKMKKELSLAPNTVFFIAGGSGMGSADGTGPQAKLNFPTGICFFDGALYLCCRGDHTIRKITSSASMGWVVETIAGKFNKQGAVDGRDSLLTSPTCCAASPRGVFFVDQGRAQSVRLLAGSSVSTVWTGDPLKNLTSLCCGADDELLVCDRGSHCIWSMSISSGRFKRLVAQDDLPQPETHEESSSFNPSAIVRVAEDSYLFCDTSCHQVFRLMVGDCVREAYEVADKIFSVEGVDAKALGDAIESYVTKGMRAVTKVKDAVHLAWSIKETMLNRNYFKELEYTQTLVRRKLVPAEGTVTMLRNAPSFYALHQFFRLMPMNSDTIMRYQEASAAFVQQYDFSSPFIDVDAELQSLARIFEDAPTSIATQELLCRVLKDDRFMCPVSEHSLRVMGVFLRTLNWTMDRTNVADLRRETVRWLTRIVLLDVGPTAHPVDALSAALRWWKEFITSNRVLVEKEKVSKDNRVYGALQWVMRVHIDSFCFGFFAPSPSSAEPAMELEKMDKSVLTVQNAFILSQIVEDCPQLVKIFGDTVADVSRTLNPVDVCSALFSSLKVRIASDKSNGVDTSESINALSEIMQHTLADITSASFSTIEQRIDKRIQQQYEKARKCSSPEELSNIENKRLNPPAWEYYNDIITHEPRLWSNLIYWTRSDTLSMTREKTKWLATLTRLYEKVERTFLEVNVNTLRGHITVDLMRKIHSGKADLELGWQILNCPLGAGEKIEELESEMQNALLEVKTIVKVLTELSPDSLMLADVQAALNNWSSLQLNTFRAMLRLPLPVAHDVHTDSFIEFHGVDFGDYLRSYAPLPSALLEALDWLFLCTEKVDFFASFWSSNGGKAVSDDNIRKVCLSWKELFDSISERTIKYSVLDENIIYISDVNEITVMAQTCLAFTDDSTSVGTQKWQYLERGSQEVIKSVGETLEILKKWRKVQALYTSEAHLARVVDSGSYTMAPSGKEELQQWKQCAQNFANAVREQGEWKNQKLYDLDSYWALADGLDEGMLRVPIKLLESIEANEPLTTFFRIVRDDNAFTSSLEVAMGLQEMECPSDLWDVDRGRVDEKYLSMTRNIRSYLYRFLYEYPAKLTSVRDFLAIFSHLNPAMSPEVIAQNLHECNLVREALMEIIRFNAEGASSSRLMKLYEPKCRSHWKLECGRNQSSGTDINKPKTSAVELGSDGDAAIRGQHELALEYFSTSHTTGEERTLKHALPELLDFQSNIVLSREGDVVGGTLHSVVDTFLHQLGWTRRLRDVFSKLSDAGHFDYYPSYSLDLSVDLKDEDFVRYVEDAETALSLWLERIARLREKFYMVNYFDIKRCYLLLNALNTFIECGSKSGDSLSTLESVVSRYVCFLNADAAYDPDIVVEATEGLLTIWQRNASDWQSSSSSELLEPLCEAVHTAFCFIPARKRTVNILDMDQYVSVPALKNGVVYSVCAPSAKAEYDQALTLYAVRGVLPEWETCMVCSKYTTLEAMSNFLMRWKKSHLFGREKCLFYLLEVQNLPYDVQEETGRLLRELSAISASAMVEGSNVSRGPLVLSCKGGKHMCPLAAQFQHSVIANSTLPARLLRKLFTTSEEGRRFSSVEVHHGKYAGCGKSFNIRLKSTLEGYTYTFVPINGPASKPQERSVILKRILGAMKSSEKSHVKPLLHMDIANSVNPSLSSIIFELCALGVVADSFGECVVCLPPGSAVCLELAATLLQSTLTHCSVYPSKVAKSNRENFHFEEMTLQQGMGEDFRSPLYDGTVGAGRGTTQSADSSTAYRRLQYVCIALNVLHYARGTFPYEFNVIDESSLSEVQLKRLLQMKEDIDSASASNMSLLATAKTLEDKEKHGVKQEKIASAHSIEKLLFTGRGIDGARAFDLLFNAIKQCKTKDSEIEATQSNSHISLWCMWSFVNVVYWQLKEMHVLDSPLNGACMPDAHTGVRSLEEDTRSKRKIKGEIFQFIIKTAGEFATRQSEVKRAADRITGVRVTGMSRSVFNKHWNRMEYDNDGKPCFRSPCATYYIYYRALANCWVIDDIIETSGATYAFSKSDDINSLWTASPEWQKTSAVSSSSGPHHADAYRGETIAITGCTRLGGNCSSTEDGIYLRQPPYDDINGFPHYVKLTDKMGEGVRRHFFFSKFRRWIVAPQCNEDEGYFIMSEGGQFSNSWLYLPPDAPERRASLTFVCPGELEVACNETKDAVEATGAHSEDEYGDEAYSSEVSEFELELLRWQDSNHECILFNNEAHTVAFLCANPSLMKRSLHPMLLRHLEQNGIHIEGGSGGGDAFSASYWKTLSALTGIAKGEKEASQLLGGTYCLTGDSLLKILAIVYRVRCGIPVVLLGECGCGKTALLSFLCAWLGVELLALDVHGGTTEADILQVFESAGQILQSNPDKSSVYVFLDEINTCAHMGLITEAICRRSVNGRRIHEGIQVLAALNPYRVRPPTPR